MVVSDGKQQIQFSSHSKKTQEKYKTSIEQQLNQFTTSAQRNRIPIININTIDPIETQLRKALGKIG